MKDRVKFVCLSMLIALVWVQPAAAAAAKLVWDYNVVIDQTCVRTPFGPPPATGFDPGTKALLLPSEPLTATGTGVLRFQDGGVVTLENGLQTEVSMTQTGVGQIPVTPPAAFRCEGTYTVDGRDLALTLTCEVPTGNPNVKISVGPQNFEGQISLNGHSIDLTNIAGDIQTISVLVSDFPVQERQRICTQHASAVR